nr:NS3 [Densovirinae sp.]
MDCQYTCDINCDCAKCLHCGLCTRGSQYHRSCYYDIQALEAGPEESLPTEEQEEEAIKIQSNTPLTAEETMDISITEAFDADEEAWMYKYTITDIDVAGKHLVKNYPYEDFDSDYYQRIKLPNYLSERVNKFQFFLMNNQWGIDLFHNKGPFRMRKGVHVRNNNVYHISCINSDSDGYEPGHFSKGLLTLEYKKRSILLKQMRNFPEIFFCGFCDHFMFDDVEYFSDETFKIPSTDIWPECTHLARSVSYDEDNYVTLFAHKIFANFPLIWAKQYDTSNIPDEQ